ncbi:MAG TPA: carboxypeptidase-like regulatory domain-containing protein [Pirellulales bacterium]
MFLFIAAGATISPVRLTESAAAADTPAASASPDTAPQTPPAAANPQSASDPGDSKFAGHFSGKVTGPDGQPLAGARVYIAADKKGLDQIGPVRATTDGRGRFEFDAADMTYTAFDGLPVRRQGLLVVTAEGYAPDWLQTWGQNQSAFRSHSDPVEGADLNLRLAAADVPIQGRFLDPDGSPLAGARVRLIALAIPRDRDLDAHLAHETHPSAGFFGGPDFARFLGRPELVPGLTTETRTDVEGRFTISGLGRDRIAFLAVSAPGVIDT